MIPTPPLNSELVDKNGQITRSGAEWLNFMWLAANSLTESGTTAQRPIDKLWIGRPFYDTTLNLPVYINAVTPAVVWRDAAGNIV